jgi:hypothetical protein
LKVNTTFSLSKSAISSALNISEIVLLIFGVVLVAGLVGEYRDVWKRWLRVFEMLVIIGVAGELLADGGIFLFSKRLQTISEEEIAQVNQSAAGANVAAETLRKQNLLLQQQLENERTQRLKLAQDVAPRYFLFQAVHPKLKQFSGTKFVVWNVQDPEAERLANLIDETLRTAGWAPIGPQMQEQNVSAGDVGIWLDYRPESSAIPQNGAISAQTSRTSDAVRELSRQLAQYNIAATPMPSDVPPATVRVRVQFQPDPESNRVMLNYLWPHLKKNP